MTKILNNGQINSAAPMNNDKLHVSVGSDTSFSIQIQYLAQKLIINARKKQTTKVFDKKKKKNPTYRAFFGSVAKRKRKIY